MSECCPDLAILAVGLFKPAGTDQDSTSSHLPSSSSFLSPLAQVPDNDEQFVPDFQTENCE